MQAFQDFDFYRVVVVFRASLFFLSIKKKKVLS